MLRRAVAVAVTMWGLAGAAPALGGGEQTQILVSGERNGLIVNANRNNRLGDSGDCTFEFRASQSGGLAILATQAEAATNRLRACTGPCFGGGFVSSDFAEASVEECDWERPPGSPSVPVVLGVSSSSSNTNSTNATARGRAQGILGPVEAIAGRLTYPADFEEFEGGEGILCNAGGPAAQVVLRDGVRIVVGITPFAGIGDFSCVDVPFELEQGGFEIFEACVPTNAQGNIDLALADDPNDPFVVLRLADLPPCSGRTAAPTATEAGLIILILSLLGLGTYRLQRRPTYSSRLPLV